MSAPAVCPIAKVPRGELERLFDEEDARWACDLKWSFEPTRRRLEGAFAERTLEGFAARDHLGTCAYATYALEGGHGTVGTFFASSRSRAGGLEDLLVGLILDQLLARGARVIDCQTLFSSDPGLKEPFATRGFESAARIYMTVERGAWCASTRTSPKTFETMPTYRSHLASAARLIYEAHAPSRDLDASSSFDTPDSCERVLRQLMLEEVCGPFDSLGSRRVEANGHTLALTLLTWPLPDVVHISEVATAPSSRRLGLARHCLTQALKTAFEQGGASCATLSVTASNQAALALYESMGFVPRIRYGSHVRRAAPRC